METTTGADRERAGKGTTTEQDLKSAVSDSENASDTCTCLAGSMEISTQPDGEVTKTATTKEQDPKSAVGDNLNASHTTEATFKFFSKLPLELRKKIWKIPCFETRNICITVRRLGLLYCDPENSEWEYTGVYVSKMRRFFYYTACSHPAVFHTCHESRVEGLENYMLDFWVEDISSFQSSTFKSQPRTYVNWKVDRLCLVAPTDFADCKKYGDLYEFVRLCRKKQPRFLAFNCYDNGVERCKAMFDGQIGWREILLFSVDKYELTKQTLKKKVAFSTFTEGIPSPLVSANPRKYGETAYKNGGDIEWEDKGDIEGIRSGERTLLRLFKKHEKELAERELEALSDDCSLPASTWRRPEIKLCTVQLKRNPRLPKDVRGLKATRALKSSQQEATTNTDSLSDSESESSSDSSSEHDDESSGAAMTDLEDEEDL